VEEREYAGNATKETDPMTMTLAECVPRVVLALVVGGLVGLERERRDRPAGIRTHMLVCGGSALITLVSMLVGGPHTDPTRIAAQIVSGIGFLGAGTIFRSGLSVRGLTTAAGLWLLAGVGMGIAAGGMLLELAVITGLIVWVINTWVRIAEDRWVRPHHDLLLTISREDEVLATVFEELAQRGVGIHEVQWMAEAAGSSSGVVRLSLHVPSSVERGALTAWLSQQPGVRQVAWE
jgi:putative Mg2+ transporter-C (MgtC) family protein